MPKLPNATWNIIKNLDIYHKIPNNQRTKLGGRCKPWNQDIQPINEYGPSSILHHPQADCIDKTNQKDLFQTISKLLKLNQT